MSKNLSLKTNSLYPFKYTQISIKVAKRIEFPVQSTFLYAMIDFNAHAIFRHQIVNACCVPFLITQKNI
jgi:hypothetical protein